jgi:hypothetical protein
MGHSLPSFHPCILTRDPFDQDCALHIDGSSLDFYLVHLWLDIGGKVVPHKRSPDPFTSFLNCKCGRNKM